MKKYTFVFLFFFVTVFFFAVRAEAATINASSCESSAVQSAISSANAGDTVRIPAGQCSWGSDISVSKKIYIEGAGKTSTVITANSGAFDLGYSGAHVGNMGFRSNSDIAIIVKGSGWRIHHCKFESTAGYKLVMVQPQSNTGGSYVLAGLIDNCEFINCRIYTRGSLANFSDSEQQHQSWTQNPALGQFDTVYIEDCVFNNQYGGNLFDSDMAGAYVARFNTMNGGIFEMHSLYNNMRGTRKWEVYNNTINNSYSSIYFPFRVRAGTGVVFNNTVSGNWDNFGVGLDNVRSYDAEPTRCDGNSAWDGNQGQSGYPCRDQIGRGYDTVQWDDNPLKTQYNQPLLPVYAWGNTQNFVVINNGISATHIQSDRDFYNHTSSFNGSSGMGSGPLSSRPSSCSVNTAYWATDQGGNWNQRNNSSNDGALYKCVSTNNWQLFYTPYVYPHPLQTGGAAPTPSYTPTPTPSPTSGVTPSSTPTPTPAPTFTPAPGGSFAIGDRIRVSISTFLRVRSAPSVSGNLLGTQSYGATGTIIGGPVEADGYRWWQINYDNNPDGWSIEGEDSNFYLVKISGSGKRGDFNNDSKVDVTDLGILLSNWNSTSRPPSDLNQDGRVDVTDLGILLSNWG